MIDGTGVPPPDILDTRRSKEMHGHGGTLHALEQLDLEHGDERDDA